jgi:DNA-binding NtrC family response regulator
VIHAADGEEALAWCRRRFADILITDIRLPGSIDGWQIAECCREHDSTLPVIYATGFSPTDYRPVAGGLVLKKPFHPDEIVSAVRRLTESSRASAELAMTERGTAAGIAMSRDPTLKWRPNSDVNLPIGSRATIAKIVKRLPVAA